LSVCDFYLWGKLKQDMYRNSPYNVEALKNEIRSVIHDIAEGKLQRLSQNFLCQCQGYFWCRWTQCEHLLWNSSE
jgi:hypothetical protein